MSSLELLAAVRASPGFRAFAAILGERIEGGRSEKAYRMLVELGAPSIVAHSIIEGWTQRHPILEELGVSPRELSMLKLAFRIDDLRRYDWPSLLSRTVRAAKPDETQ